MEHTSQEQSRIDDWLGRLQRSGYRATGPRRIIVEIIASSQKALGPLEVYDLGRQQYPGLGLVTIYRTLEKLEELELVQRVHQPDGCHRYLPASVGHQHLLICSGCGQVAFFTGDDLTFLFDRVSERTGFEVNEHWLQLFGLCPNCRAAQSGN